jgi:hypothetical protein
MMEVQAGRAPKALAEVTKRVAEMIDDTGSATQRILSVEKDDAGRTVWYLRSQQGEKLGSFMTRADVPDDEFGQMRLAGELGAYFKARVENHKGVA